MAGADNNIAGGGGQPVPLRTMQTRKWIKTDGITKVSTMVKVSIYDIPNDRFDDVLDHMCEYFLADDVICKSFKIKDDQTAVQDFRTLLIFILCQNMSIGAFRVKPDGTMGKLVGVNLLYVPTDGHEKWISDHTTNSTSPAFINMFAFLRGIWAKVDIRKKYGVKEYLADMGLSVKPNYRDHNIEIQLLEERRHIGLNHNLTVTAGFFKDSKAQDQARGASFKTILPVTYAGVFDQHGSPLFPNVETQALELMAVKTFVYN